MMLRGDLCLKVKYSKFCFCSQMLADALRLTLIPHEADAIRCASHDPSDSRLTSIQLIADPDLARISAPWK